MAACNDLTRIAMGRRKPCADKCCRRFRGSGRSGRWFTPAPLKLQAVDDGGSVMSGMPLARRFSRHWPPAAARHPRPIALHQRSEVTTACASCSSQLRGGARNRRTIVAQIVPESPCGAGDSVREQIASAFGPGQDRHQVSLAGRGRGNPARPKPACSSLAATSK